MEYVKTAVIIITMEIFVSYNVLVTVRMDVAKVESAMDANLIIGDTIVVPAVQSYVMVSVTKTLGTVHVAKSDTMDLNADLHVLRIVMGAAIKTLDTAIAILDTGEINVKLSVQVTVQLMNVSTHLGIVLEDVKMTGTDQNVTTAVRVVTSVMTMEGALMVLD